MNINDTLKKIKALFADMPQEAPTEEAPAPTEYKLKDGTAVTIDNLAAGGIVMIAGVPAPAGEHILEDGTALTVDMNGVILEVKGGEAPAEEMQQPDKYAEQFATIDGKFAEMTGIIDRQNGTLQRFDAALKQSNEALQGLLQVVEKIANGPAAAPVEAPRQQFVKETPVTKEEVFANVASYMKKVS